jgi:hypothetical protein
VAIRNVPWASCEGAVVSYDYDDADEGVTAVRVTNPAGSGRTFTLSLLDAQGVATASRSWAPGTADAFNVRPLNRTRLLDKLGRTVPFASARLEWK